MNRDAVTAELIALTQEVGATPCKVRVAVRERLGSDIEHPLIVYSPKGPAMRIYTKEGIIWVPVPEAWMFK